ncbi:MAG: hypothetical protein IPK07_28420 [Deltaproteobacteria bacterium]|nr:hypothetical protein [Deltaproteobacteria bacterium]
MGAAEPLAHDESGAMIPVGASRSSERTEHAGRSGAAEARTREANPLRLSLMYTTGMLLVGLGLPGAPFAALALYFEGTFDWPEAVQAASWLIAIVAVLGSALWIAASHLDRRA